MKIKIKKFNIWKYIIAGLFVPLIPLSMQSFADEFSPLDLISGSSIKLDSSQIPFPELNFPAPSEYQTQIYKNTGGAFEPPVEPPVIAEPNIPEPIFVENIKTKEETKIEEVKTDEVSTEEELPDIEDEFTPLVDKSSPLKRDEQSKKSKEIKFIPFEKNEDLIQPSDYKYVKKMRSKPAVKEELIPEFPYYASAQSEEYGEEDYEGKIISSIKISGLDYLKPELILNTIDVREGAEFNSELLQRDLQKLYALGYFTENISIEPEILDDNTIELNFVLQENVPIKNIKINGNTVYSDSELMQYLNKLINMPESIAVINECINDINKHYKTNGYILAHVSSIDDTPDGTFIVNISEGIIQKFEFNEDKKTKDYVIERNMLTKPGSVYNEELIKKDITRIYATQIFDDIERTIEQCPDKEGEYIVKIKVKESSSDSISIGGGVDSALGIFGSLGISDRNFLGRGQYLGLSGMIGSGILLSDASIKNRMNYNIELNFREPYFLNADNSLASKIYYRDLGSYQIPLAIERRFGINGVVTHKVKGHDNLRTSLGLGYEHISLSEGDWNKISSIFRARAMNISDRSKQLTGGSFLNISPSITYSNVDDETMPRKGMIAKASFIEALGLSRTKNTNGRLAGKITKYIPVFKKSTLALTGKGGIKVHGNDMPEVMAFSLGGPYSIRGFRMNGVGSGSSFLMGSAELQTPIPFFDRFKYDILKNMRFAFFVDAGRVYGPTTSSKLYDRPLSAVSMGVGLRIYVPKVGPISLDYALPLTHVGKYNPNGGYFTFGTFGLYDNY